MPDDAHQVEYLLAETGSPKQRLKIKLTQLNGFPLLDLRMWYQNAEGEWCPTKKGLSLSAGRYSSVAEALARFSRAIQLWLAGETDISEEIQSGASERIVEIARRSHEAQLVAAERATLSAAHVLIDLIEDDRVRFAFDVDHEGGTDRVLLNLAHPFARRLHETDSADEMRGLVVDMISAYARARKAVASEEEEGLLNLLDHEWSQRLRALPRTKRPH